MVEAEREDKLRQRKLKKGAWNVFAAACAATEALGPRAPTVTEGLGDVQDETITIDRQQRQYRLTPATVAWVAAYLDGGKPR